MSFSRDRSSDLRRDSSAEAIMMKAKALELQEQEFKPVVRIFQLVSASRYGSADECKSNIHSLLPIMQLIEVKITGGIDFRGLSSTVECRRQSGFR